MLRPQEMAGYGTHVPILAAVVAATPHAPILELGCGAFSTRLLHFMCRAQGNRVLVTAESDDDWGKIAEELSGGAHRWERVKDWATYQPWSPATPYSVVFVDQAPMSARPAFIRKWKDHPLFLGATWVVHDAQSPELAQSLVGFRYRDTREDSGTWTAVCSDGREWKL